MSRQDYNVRHVNDLSLNYKLANESWSLCSGAVEVSFVLAYDAESPDIRFPTFRKKKCLQLQGYGGQRQLNLGPLFIYLGFIAPIFI